MQPFYTVHEHIMAQVQSCAFAMRYTTEALATEDIVIFDDSSRVLAILQQTLGPEVDRVTLKLEGKQLSITVDKYDVDNDVRYQGAFILDTRNGCIVKDAHTIT